MYEIRTEVTIAAPAERVWAALTNFPAMSSWNPFIRHIDGEPRPGSRLSLQIAPPGKRPMRFRPKVLVADPGREFRWLGQVLFPGLFDGEHWFRLAEPSPGQTLLEHGETFSGLLPRLMGRHFLEPTRQGFEAMNAALKRHLEPSP